MARKALSRLGPEKPIVIIAGALILTPYHTKETILTQHVVENWSLQDNVMGNDNNKKWSWKYCK